MSDEETTETTQREAERNYGAEALAVLEVLRSGTVLYELGLGLATVGAAIRNAGKGKGKIVLTLDLASAQKGGGSALNVAGSVKVTPPREEVAETLMYTTNDGKLSRRHPDQPTIPGFAD